MQFAVQDAFNGLFDHPEVPSIQFLAHWKSDNHYQPVILARDEIPGLCKTVDPNGRRLLIVPIEFDGARHGNAVFFEESHHGRVAYHGPGDIEGILSGTYRPEQCPSLFEEEWLDVCPAESLGPDKLLVGTAQLQGINCIAPVAGSL